MSELQDALALAVDLQCYSAVDAEPVEPQTWAESTLETAISVTCAELSMATSEAEQREVFARIQQPRCSFPGFHTQGGAS